ncbi:MAG: sigma-70 family RNA polymerase sigma factor [Oscillospiraceae bacterium]|nr:sigma-70 family RNA polymerase sigma factor [Oscillospiraceae bacterium]
MYNSPAISMTKNTAEAFVEHEFPPSNEVTGLTDNEIISLFNARNERALSAVSEKYGVNCSRIAKNILKNDQDAEECVNDTYLKVWESIPPEQPDSLCAYVAKVTRNSAIDRYRSEHSEKRGGGEIPLILDELAECVSDNSSVELTAERHELLAAVNEYLETLPEEKRIAFVSRYTLCESVKSIAQRLGITQNNVSVNLGRTRKGLIDYLKRKGFEI